MKMIIQLYFVLIIVCIVVSDKVRYDGFKVYKISIDNKNSLNILTDMEDDEGYQFLNYPRMNDSSLLVVAPEKIQEFENVVNNNKMSVALMMDNLQRYIDEENPNVDGRSNFDWTAYHRLNVIYQWMESLAQDYPKIVNTIDAGISTLGTPIKGLKLQFNSNKNTSIFLESGIHAREWISVATTTYIANELLFSKDPVVRNLAESHVWYIFPVFNPDGYEYTHSTNRLWRKNLKRSTWRCKGVDLNRNWDTHWSEIGSSSNPCSEIYAGQSAFSEIESKSMSTFINNIPEKMKAYLAFHSYSQLLLIPFGHSNERIDNYDDLMEIGRFSVKALAMRYGTNYTVGNIVDVIYPASGGSMDWVRATIGPRITYTYELRDKGRYAFLLPSDQIIPTGEETMDSLIGMFQKASDLGY
ncbi:PREDICTED: zinc carboxypeptidase-like [Polistes dominula]|uniref:Zinc carboxypeptidase-like n=1 Tax=Polistes dominula TaxID=743375 RepID=A0ABM1I2F4_POLDO|nr:PREDICTED: zinc carboxypeptidase-like [Polistes dominula]